MAKVTGSVDDLGRPVVRVEVPGHDGFLAVIDTGFNRSLMLLAAEAAAMGFALREETETVELGTTARVEVRSGVGNPLARTRAPDCSFDIERAAGEPSAGRCARAHWDRTALGFVAPCRLR